MNRSCSIVQSRLITACILLAWCAACRFNPLAGRDRVLPHALFAEARIGVISWPDTLPIGEIRTAEIEVLLADGSPFIADYVYWYVNNSGILEIYPHHSKETKRLRGVAAGQASIRISAYVRKAFGKDEFYLIRDSLNVVVVP